MTPMASNATGESSGDGKRRSRFSGLMQRESKIKAVVKKVNLFPKNPNDGQGSQDPGLSRGRALFQNAVNKVKSLSGETSEAQCSNVFQNETTFQGRPAKTVWYRHLSKSKKDKSPKNS